METGKGKKKCEYISLEEYLDRRQRRNGTPTQNKTGSHRQIPQNTVLEFTDWLYR